MPLFDFLEIPNNLKKKFELPKGCVVTKETLALRQRKMLGGNKTFVPLTAAMLRDGYTHPVLPTIAPCDEDDGDMEELPVAHLPPFEPLVLWTNPDDPEHKIEVIPTLAAKLRPHQREGVAFMFQCIHGLRDFAGAGCILADDMGLGKTLQSIALLHTVLRQGMVAGAPTVKRAVGAVE